MNRRFKAGVSIIAYRYLIKYILTPFKSLYLDISKKVCTFASVKQINKKYEESIMAYCLPYDNGDER